MAGYQEALDAAIAAVREAGAALREGLTHKGEAWRYDRQAEGILRARLRAATPWSYRSDEAGYLVGRERVHMWLTDPNDGTFHYNRGARGSAVAVAALRSGEPVLGVIYAFAFPDHAGDLIAWAEGCGSITRNGQPITHKLSGVPLDSLATPFDPRMIIALSPSADNYPHAAAEHVAPARYVTSPSLAYRLALVAVGEAAATVSLNNPCAWDYAAGHALLRAAGGVFLDQDGAAVTYTPDGVSTVEYCFAGDAQAVASLRKRSWAATAVPPPPEPAQVLLRQKRFAPAARAAKRIVADAALLARAQGCLLGQLAGDALGGMVEFEGPEQIKAKYPDGCRDMRDGGAWKNLAGQPTDDSELALLLARSLADQKGHDEEAVLKAYLDWWHDPRTYDRGNTLRRALTAAAKGATHEQRRKLIEENASQSSESNGSLMRVSPLGIYAAGRPAMAADLARRDSALTHPNPVCRDSCAVYAAAIATAVAGGTAQAAYEAALAEAARSKVHPTVREAVEAARHRPPADYLASQGWVLVALGNAFYQLLHAPSVEEGIVSTVMSGGDSDTNAAIAGALLGAVYGREAVPPRWRQCVLSCRMLEGTPTAHPRAREYWPVDALELAECVLMAGQVAAE